MGETFRYTYEANPGEVWEEDEFWIELSLAHRPRRRARHPPAASSRPTGRARSSPSTSTTAGSSRTRCPACPRRRPREGLTPARVHAPVRRVPDRERRPRAAARSRSTSRRGATRPGDGRRDARTASRSGVEVDGEVVRRLPDAVAQARDLLADACATGAGRSRRCPATSAATSTADASTPRAGEMVLLPTFRLPTLDPHPQREREVPERDLAPQPALDPHRATRERLGLETGDLVRVTTEIGYFVNRVWVTEAIAPGVVACSHHLGRWRLHDGEGSRWSTAARVACREARGRVRCCARSRASGPFESADPDSSRIWWSDGGVHQNLTFPVHPDPVSGMHCWHQKVVVGARAGRRPLRRRLRRHGAVDGGLPRVAGPDAPGSGPRRAAAAAVAGPPAASGGRRCSGVRYAARSGDAALGRPRRRVIAGRRVPGIGAARAQPGGSRVGGARSAGSGTTSQASPTGQASSRAADPTAEVLRGAPRAHGRAPRDARSWPARQ